MRRRYHHSGTILPRFSECRRRRRNTKVVNIYASGHQLRSHNLGDNPDGWPSVPSNYAFGRLDHTSKLAGKPVDLMKVEVLSVDASDARDRYFHTKKLI